MWCFACSNERNERKTENTIFKFAVGRSASAKASLCLRFARPPSAMSCGRLACRRPFDFLSNGRVRLLCFFPLPPLRFPFLSFLWFLFSFPIIVTFPILSSFSFTGALFCLLARFHITCDCCASDFCSKRKAKP
jgi:hypothetical protein